MVLPIGSPQYVADFLANYATRVERLVDSLVELVHIASPEAPARQSAMLLLRHCAASKAAHLLRLLPPDVTKGMVTRIDAAVLRGVGLINGIAAADVAKSAVRIGLPISDGGLGLRPLEWTRHTAYLAGWLQCAAGVADAVGDAIPQLRCWATGTLACQAAVREVEHHLREAWGVDALETAGASWVDFAAVAREKRQRDLTRATIQVRCDRWKAQANPRDCQTLLSGSCHDGRPGAGAWLTIAPEDPALSLSDEAFAFAVRLRLGLRLASEGDRCSVYNQTSRTPCGLPLSPFADHAAGCARAARNARHNFLRDWWIAVVREAGGRALPEQWVTEYAPHKAVRADAWAVLSPGAGVTYYDVVVSHPFTTGVPTGSVGELRAARPTADAAIGPACADKHSTYAPPRPDGDERGVARVNAIPLAFDTHGRWGHDAVQALRAAARRRLVRPDAQQCVPSPQAYAKLLLRWRAAGAIAIQRGNFDVWRACLPGGEQGAPEAAAAEAPCAAGCASMLPCLLL